MVKHSEDLSQWPWATLLAVTASIVLGITSIVDGDALNYNELSTMLVITWGALALGRGLAAKHDDAYWATAGPLTRFLNKFNWSTVVIAVFAVAGYIIQLGSTPMGWDVYAQKVGALAGALAIGRGLSVLKRDTTTGVVPLGVPQDVDHEITNEEENVDEMTHDLPIPPERGHGV